MPQYTTRELAELGLPGFPRTPQGWDMRVKGEAWAFVEVTGARGRGGVRREFIPPAPLQVLIDAHVAAKGQDTQTAVEPSKEEPAQAATASSPGTTVNAQAAPPPYVPPPPPSPADFLTVPRYDVRASAGGGSLIHSEMVVDHLAFRREWITRLGLVHEKLALIEVRGDSMMPTLSNSDLVLVDLRPQDLSGDGVYVIQYDGHLLVKRLQHNFDGSVVILSDNPVYRAQKVSADEAERLRLLGRVVWFGRQM